MSFLCTVPRSIGFAFFAALINESAFAQEQIIPRPAEISYPAALDGKPVKMGEGITLVCEEDAAFVKKANDLVAYLQEGMHGRRIGKPIAQFGEHSQEEQGREPSFSGIIIEVKKDAALASKGSEAYAIDARPGHILIRAATPKGVFYAGQSIAQMLPSEFFDDRADKRAVDWVLADKGFSIVDYPRFSWRALMLDEARHFFGEEECKRILDQMALLKLNVFHWHLSDDSGWRVEMKKFPRLTEVGSKRRDTETGTWGSGTSTGKPYEGFYTQDQIRRIVKYAADRNITVVPEIDVPGHSAAAIVSYPELKLTAKPLKEVPVNFSDGAAFDPTSRETYKFLSMLFDEIATLFPGKLIHIGGDEVRYQKYWGGVPHIDAYMKKNKIPKYTDLQMMFTNRISEMLAKKGLRVIGWNEVLGTDIHNDGGQGAALGKLDPAAIIHFWTGAPKIAKDAIAKGHKIINSTYQMTYINRKDIPLKKAYSFEPVFDGLSPEEEKSVLGLGCQVWTEWVPDIHELHDRIYPRIAAYSEIGWTPKKDRDYESFLKRVQEYKKLLEKKGIGYGNWE